MHHIITDGFSHGILQDDLLELYGAIAQDRDNTLKPLAFQYRDFVKWQRKFIHSPDGDEHKAYWLARLNGFRREIRSAGPAAEDREDNACRFFTNRIIRHKFYEDIDRFTRDNSLTKPILLMGTLVLLINRLSRQQDLTVLTNVSGRDSKYHRNLDVSKLIGFFANTLLIRNIVDEEATVLDQLHGIRDHFLEDLTYEAYPFLQLLRDLPGISLPDFLQDTAFYNHHNYDYLNAQDYPSEEMESSGQIVNSGLESRALGLTVYEYGNCLRLHWIIKPGLFPAYELAEVADLYLAMLKQIVSTPQMPVRKLKANVHKSV